MVIKKLICGDNEENSTIYIINKNGVISIQEHRSMGDGDKWYYDIICNKDIIRVFNPLVVYFQET